MSLRDVVAKMVRRPGPPLCSAPLPETPGNRAGTGHRCEVDHTRAPPPGWWRRRDGDMMRIADMDDGHLCNTVRMLARMAGRRRARMAAGNYEEWRAVEVARYLSYPEPNGDGAQMAWERGLMELVLDEDRVPEEPPGWNDGFGRHVAKYEELLEEAARRGVEVEGL